MRFSARIFGIIIAILLVFSVFKSNFTNAQGPVQGHQTQQSFPINANQGISNNLHTYAQSVLIETLSAVGCQLAGIDPANPKQQCLDTDPNTGKLGFMQHKGGLLGLSTSMISILYNPPIHTSDYVHYLAGNFGISKGAYAQTAGVGLTTIAPIANLWILFRNITYLLFVIVFVAIGVAIMLRVRIDPRTVMTIQNRIPKLIIGIILVTISFPIAGFLIDLMWLAILLVVNTFTPLLTNVSAYNFVTPFGLSGIIPGGVLGVAGGTSGFIGSSIFNSGFTANNVNTLVALPSPTCGFLDLPCILGGALSAALGAIFGFILGIVVGLIAFFVITVALLYALFKVWFELLKAYVSILIGIIFAPFWILFGLIPGSGEKVGFGAWLRDMFGNLMAFPVAIGLFFLAAIFATQFNGNSTVFFLPPLIGPQNNSFGVVIAFGLLMMTPNAVKITKTIFKSSGSGFGSIGQGLGVGQAVFLAAGGRTWHTLTKRPNYQTNEQAGLLRQYWEGPTRPGGPLGWLKRRTVGNPEKITGPKANPETPQERLTRRMDEHVGGNTGGEKK